MRKKGRDELNHLRQLASFTTSRIILTANTYRLFDHLEEGGKTALQLSRKLATDKRATELLINSLVALGLLKKTNILYANTGLSSQFLVSGKPDYQGDIISHYNILWDNWSGLDTVLKTGKPHKKSFNHRSFIMGMHNLSLPRVQEVFRRINLKGVKRILDLGGGPGTYSIAFAHKRIHATLMDYPETLKIAKKLIKKAGVEKLVRLLPGDFSTDDIGSNYDLILISQIFHAYNAEASISILKKSHRALSKGGRVVVQEFLLNESRTSPQAGALFAINMLVNTVNGRTYTPKEMISWLKKAGFSTVRKTILNDYVLVTGTKK
jgi:ubiquinone/menaquinone biosynthesis C-methylase UbiE